MMVSRSSVVSPGTLGTNFSNWGVVAQCAVVAHATVEEIKAGSTASGASRRVHCAPGGAATTNASAVAQADFDATVAAIVDATTTALAAETPVERSGDSPPVADGTVVVMTLATPVPTIDVDGLGPEAIVSTLDMALSSARSAAESAARIGLAAGADEVIDPQETLQFELALEGAEAWAVELRKLIGAHASALGEAADRQTVETADGIERVIEATAARDWGAVDAWLAEQ